jgi:hypothetical protein
MREGEPCLIGCHLSYEYFDVCQGPVYRAHRFDVHGPLFMSSMWAAVDDLMRELGSVRHAAGQVRASATARTALENAIREAAVAVDLTIDGPQNPGKLMAARDALGVAEEVILALDADMGRSLRVRARGQLLRERAAELIRRAS